MRALSRTERALILKLVGVVENGQQLAKQVDHVRVCEDSTPTFLRLNVKDAQAANVPDGIVPGRFPVTRNDELLGELMLWVTDGWLSGLEFAWVTDSAPAHMPDADEVQIG